MVRIAVIDKSKCNPVACGNLCIKLCPVNRMGKECITLSPITGKAQIDEKLCTGCGICPNRCPFGAISIVNLPEDICKQPIHQYGKNGFHLYGLPTPIFGKVVGILGRNGIGKSTAMNIFAGILSPNFGRIEEENNKKENGEIKNNEIDNSKGYEKLIDFFKGTETQSFFEKVKKGEITIAYKPQVIESIPKLFKGSVIDLLKKIDEKNKLNEIVDVLDLRSILNRDISIISGGELQRVAIAATVLKKANLYIFDEPTSYLDIKQRINISKFIKKLADENTSVMVVEHDLIILDFMTDIINVVYGKPGVYGIVSQIKPTKTGINSYLEGFLKEENMRIRDKPIKFNSVATHLKELKTPEMSEWEGIKKKLGSFELEALGGHLREEEVVGIVGENGIGKTTFMKILAGELKTDAGEIKEKIKVSYKPQYIQAMNIPVRDLLKEAIKKYKIELIAPLELEGLLNKKVDELSGGELQRVAIAECLSKEADVYLLDEPSAYLDIEQRLKLGKIISGVLQNRRVCTVIIDHDLSFIDSVSNRLGVFDGTPSVKGILEGPFDIETGMNKFLSKLNITLRRDKITHRPRINKEHSQKDEEQKRKGNYYYS